MSAVPRAANEPRTPLELVVAEAVKEALDKRLPTLVAVGLVPPRYVLFKIASSLIGYTEKALDKKVDSGVFVENREYRIAPDGRRHIDFRGYEAWVEKGKPGDDE